MGCSDKDFVDFIDQCTEWKPEKRLTPELAFSHPFISRAVNELKCLKENPPSSGQAAQPTKGETAAQPGAEGGYSGAGAGPATGNQHSQRSNFTAGRSNGDSSNHAKSKTG